jgi:hypothetical protein
MVNGLWYVKKPSYVKKTLRTSEKPFVVLSSMNRNSEKKKNGRSRSSMAPLAPSLGRRGDTPGSTRGVKTIRSVFGFNC